MFVLGAGLSAGFFYYKDTQVLKEYTESDYQTKVAERVPQSLSSAARSVLRRYDSTLMNTKRGLRYVQFDNVDLTASPNPKFKSGYFSGTDFSNSWFKNMNLKGIFKKAKFKDAEFTQSDLEGVFNGAIFEDARFVYVKLNGDFIRANFQNARLTLYIKNHNSFKKAKMQGAEIDLEFKDDHSKVSFEGAYLQGAKLKIRGFFQSEVMGASLRIEGHNVPSTASRLLNFKGAFYDSSTIFPRGFNPEKFGMIKVD